MQLDIKHSVTRFHRIPAILAFGLLLAINGCQSVKTTQGGTIGVERVQRMSPLVSEAQL
jgi:hypothetical protein